MSVEVTPLEVAEAEAELVSSGVSRIQLELVDLFIRSVNTRISNLVRDYGTSYTSQLPAKIAIGNASALTEAGMAYLRLKMAAGSWSVVPLSSFGESHFTISFNRL